MASIGIDQIQAVYRLSKQVREAVITEQDAAEMLVAQHSMNYSSAMGYLRKLRQMLAAENFTRTMNKTAMRYYLSNIEKDFGQSALASAIVALNLHIAYYEGVGKGRATAMRQIAEEFARSLAVSDFDAIEMDFRVQVEKSAKLGGADRKALLPQQGHKPSSKFAMVRVFNRSPHVVAETLDRANGVCEACQTSAPFKKRKDGSYYLEVHHKITLAEGGDDTLDNSEALCPNCHRERHYG